MCLSQSSPCASSLLQPDAREGWGGDGRGMEMVTVVGKGCYRIIEKDRFS